VDLEFLDPDTDLTPIIPALEAVFAEAMGKSVSELNFKSITDRLSGVMYDFPFRVPAYYALIIRSLLTLEGIAIGLDPNFKVLSVAYPYVAQRLLTDPAPELRVSLRELLFNQGQFRWNRLENLLRNAVNSEDFDLQGSLEKAVDFIFSERGAFLRERLVDVLFSSSGSQGGSDGLAHFAASVGTPQQQPELSAAAASADCCQGGCQTGSSTTGPSIGLPLVATLGSSPHQRPAIAGYRKAQFTLFPQRAWRDPWASNLCFYRSTSPSGLAQVLLGGSIAVGVNRGQSQRNPLGKFIAAENLGAGAGAKTQQAGHAVLLESRL
jgi:hypothetical protein